MSKKRVFKDNPENSTSVDANIGGIRKLTQYWTFRAENAGLNVDREEIEAEVMLAFSKAQSRFDRSKGYRFSTFYYVAVKNEMSKWVQKQLNQSQFNSLTSLDEQIGSEDGLTLVETTSNGEDMVHEIEVQEIAKSAFSNLSKESQIVVNWMIDQPEALRRELVGRQHKAEYGARLLNRRKAKPSDVSPELAVEFMARLAKMDMEGKKRIQRELHEFKMEVAEAGYDRH